MFARNWPLSTTTFDRLQSNNNESYFFNRLFDALQFALHFSDPWSHKHLFTFPLHWMSKSMVHLFYFLLWKFQHFSFIVFHSLLSNGLCPCLRFASCFHGKCKIWAINCYEIFQKTNIIGTIKSEKFLDTCIWRTALEREEWKEENCHDISADDDERHPVIKSQVVSCGSVVEAEILRPGSLMKVKHTRLITPEVLAWGVRAWYI